MWKSVSLIHKKDMVMEFNRSGCQRILKQILKASPASASGGATQVILSSYSSALTRFANNGIHQNMVEEGTQLTVRVVLDKKTARATTNRLDREAIRQVIETACHLARLAPEEDLPGLPGRQQYPRLRRLDPQTARFTPRQRAKRVQRAIELVKARSLNSAGFLSNQVTTTAMANSQGLFTYDRHTQAEFSITVLAQDSSGWAKATAPSVNDLVVEEMTEQAIQKAILGQSPKDLEPGAYTVILEPAAVADLLSFMVSDFSALSVHLKKSFLTGKVGSRLFGENVSIVDDVAHPLQMGLPFDGDGIPRKRMVLVDRGVAKNLVCSLTTAKKLGKKATGHGMFFETGEVPMNIVMAGGRVSVDEMIASTERGLLVTRFWYIREVDPTRKILTGMTRDGTFYIHKGCIQHGVKNLRFNQGLIEMLQNVEMLGRPVQASGEEHYGCMVMPPMKVREFKFTGKTVF
jgi:predicted Zn-dependent protease